MKRLAMFLVVLFAAATMFAGGKECNVKTAGKAVELNGTLRADAGKTFFHVASSNTDYAVCEKTKQAVLNVGTDGKPVHVKGKVVSCGENTELLIESANKI